MPQINVSIDVAAAIIAFIALLISFYSLFVTRIKEFDGNVVPVRRLSLTWAIQENEIPCISLECQFINNGARSGKIEDIIVQLQNLDGGESVPYIVFLARKEVVDIYVEATENEQWLQSFSTIWLRAGESQGYSIFFKSPKPSLYLEAGNTYRVRLLFTGDNTKGWFNRKRLNWKYSPISFNFQVTAKNLEEWTNGKTILIESYDLDHNRKDLFSHLQV